MFYWRVKPPPDAIFAIKIQNILLHHHQQEFQAWVHLAKVGKSQIFSKKKFQKLFIAKKEMSAHFCMQSKEIEKKHLFLNGLPADLEKAGLTFNMLENGLRNRVLKYFTYKQGVSSKKKKEEDLNLRPEELAVSSKLSRNFLHRVRKNISRSA